MRLLLLPVTCPAPSHCSGVPVPTHAPSPVSEQVQGEGFSEGRGPASVTPRGGLHAAHPTGAGSAAPFAAHMPSGSVVTTTQRLLPGHIAELLGPAARFSASAVPPYSCFTCFRAASRVPVREALLSPFRVSENTWFVTFPSVSVSHPDTH